MRTTCPDCRKAYDDADRLTSCPHDLIMPAADLERKKAAIELLNHGGVVRFNHQADTGPDYHIMAVDFIGMVTLRGFTGEFAPHLFVSQTKPTP